MITITRHQDIDCGHRVVGHEGHCQHLHGHTYRIHFTCTAKELDCVGRIIDFGIIKAELCEWILANWDHRFIAWDKDKDLRALSNVENMDKISDVLQKSIVWVPFNPTAENIANYLLRVVGPRLLPPEVTLIKVRVEETQKCSAEVILGD